MLSPEDEQEQHEHVPSRYEDFTTIDWTHDIAIERKRRKRFHQQDFEPPAYTRIVDQIFNFNEHPERRQTFVKLWRQLAIMWDAAEAWILVAMVGVSVGVMAAIIEVLTGWLADLKDGICRLPGGSGWYLNRKFCCWESSLDQCEGWRSWNQVWLNDRSSIEDITGLSQGFMDFMMYALLALTMAIASFYLVYSYAPYAASSGLPEVRTILGGFVIRRFISWDTGIIKSLAVSLAVGSGLSIGKEAPFVHIACCIGSIFPRFFSKYARNEAKKRELLSASSAAGIAVAFGAPIAGVLFSLEEISTFFPQKTLWRAFFCSIVAAASMQALDPFRTGKLIMFQSSYTRPWHVWEVFFFMLVGGMGGLFGVAMIHLNMRLAEWRRSDVFWTTNNPRWLDWLAWVPKVFNRIVKWAATRPSRAPIDSDSDASDDEQPEETTPNSTQEESSDAKRWWAPRPTVVKRCFQELVLISLLTSCISFAHPYLRGDMAYFLSGLLRECPRDQLPVVPAEFGQSLVNVTYYPSSLTAMLFTRDDTPVSAPIPVESGDSSAGGRGHGVVGEEIDYYHLCDQSPSRLIPLLIFSCFLRIALTTITFGTRVPAGVFLPSMVIGACFGRAVGLFVSVCFPNFVITPGTYALVGAAAALGGVTKLTVSVAVIMFEITGGGALIYIVPIMIALMTAKFVGDAADPDSLGSISDAYIKFHKYPLLDLKRNLRFLRSKEVITRSDNHIDKKIAFESCLVKDFMTPRNALMVIPIYDQFGQLYHHTVGSIEQMLKDTRFQGYPLIETIDDYNLAGFITRQDIVWLIERSKQRFSIPAAAPCYFSSDLTAPQSSQFRECINFAPWIEQTPLTFPSHYPMDLVVEMFKKLGLRYLLVLNEGTGSLKDIEEAGSVAGIMTKKDILRSIEKLAELEQEPILETMHSSTVNVSRASGFSQASPTRRSRQLGDRLRDSFNEEDAE